MKVLIKCCMFVLSTKESTDIRKNDEYQIKLLVDANNELISTKVENDKNIKESIRAKLESITGTSKFHLEQVYTLGDNKYADNELDIIYLAITNEEFITKNLGDYKLIDFDIINKDSVILENSMISYHTEQKITDGGIEYLHVIDTEDLKEEKKILELIIAYKYLKSRIDNTDILFKFLPAKFTLESVRQVYEMITSKTVDKSNFRKRIINYVEAIDETINKGYRPTQLYKFKVNKNDIWI